ncbi:MAG: alpha-2-macroglobulin family protein [Planctomycetia bacterium]|nr:alpha-2-macroglobulin family protein [Planctomycetia bacterium]
MAKQAVPAAVTIANPDDPVAECAAAVTENHLYKEALDVLYPWSLKSEGPSAGRAASASRAQAIDLVVQCLTQLNRVPEIDAYLEEIAGRYSDDWLVLQTVAQHYMNLPHEGSLLDGTYVRGDRSGRHSGQDSFVSTADRDRVRALQLYDQAATVVESARRDESLSHAGLKEFYRSYAEAVRSVPDWQLQVLTDITTLPDPEPYHQWRLRVQQGRGAAPVDAQGEPVFYTLPQSWSAAANDGQRWRFLLQAGLIDPADRPAVLLTLADFYRGQFGVQTLAGYPFFNRTLDAAESEVRDAGIWSLEELPDSETIARLASGIKRFTMPEEVNYISLLRQVVELGNKQERIQAKQTLADEFRNRRQYERAAEMLQSLLSEAGPGDLFDAVREQYEQIVGNWGRFEPQCSSVRGSKTQFSWLWRNGRSVEFTAQRIDIPALVAAIKTYLKKMENKNVSKLDYNKISIGNLGYDLVAADRERKQYLKEQAAAWTVPLDPAPGHMTRSKLIDLPITASGAYLVTGKMADGNEDTIIVWVNDTALVQKMLDGELCCFAADAKDGTPVAGLNLNFFAYGSREVENPIPLLRRENRYVLAIRELDRATDENGLVFLNDKDLYDAENDVNYQWMITTKTKASEGTNEEPARFAFLGFEHFWYRNWYNSTLNETKAWFASDRPVYRPGQNVEYKFWVGETRYDLPKENVWANKPVRVCLCDPDGTVVTTSDTELDPWGGVTASWTIPDDAKLGLWSVIINRDHQSNDWLGCGTFRIEEYKKPEFEVAVDAPQDPVKLGDTFKIKIHAKYYFGAPVTQAEVKYTVTRTKHTEIMYPVRPWDWFYGNGYAWFGYDYTWYPGWERWGCPRPVMAWWGMETGVPEVVLERTVPIGPDGSVDVELDSSLAAVLYPNDDQKYTVTAEVVDNSRRTIVGTGTVLVAREPFKVNCSLNRGYLRTGSQISAAFEAHRMDGKAVAGEAAVKLFRVRYELNEGDNPTAGFRPVEEEVSCHQVVFDENGKSELTLNAAAPGQYRLSCSLTDSQGHACEGACVFLIRPAENAELNDSNDTSFHFSQLELVPEQSEYAPGETLNLLVNTDQKNSTVLLFPRSVDGVAQRPHVLRLNGQSQIVPFTIEQADMPNIFFEALTVSDGHVFTEQKEIVVPPEKKILNLEILPDAETYRPGDTAKVRVRVTDLNDQPVVGQVTAVVYDKSVEYISGGSNIAKIKEFFWQWRRSSSPSNRHNLERIFHNITPPGSSEMSELGIFRGYDTFAGARGKNEFSRKNFARVEKSMAVDSMVEEAMPMMAEAPMMNAKASVAMEMDMASDADMAMGANDALVTGGGLGAPGDARDGGAESGALVDAVIRQNFADTAFWAGDLVTDANGETELEVAMPENLTTWKIRLWSLASGTRVGEATTEIITKKNLIIRMQRPRFLVDGDQVTLSANVHNYLAQDKEVSVSLTFPDTESAPVLTLDDGCESLQKVRVPAGGEVRVDWLVRAQASGRATLTMQALTDEESDAMQETMPVYVHGMLKQEAVSGRIARSETESASGASDLAEQTFTVTVPDKRRPAESLLTVRFSPTLAGAAMDALPYLASYPYGCTEQTLNRFLPTVLVRKSLTDLGIDMRALAEARANLNAQELGDPATRREQWKNQSRTDDHNPIYDDAEINLMIQTGLEKLKNMQCADGGWGWFSGYGERSTPHLTALVLRGLALAQKADCPVYQDMIDRGRQWLLDYQRRENQRLLNGQLWDDATKQKRPAQWKSEADNLNVYVYYVLSELNEKSSAFDVNGKYDPGMSERLNDHAFSMAFMKHAIWNARTSQSLYSLALFAMALCNESGSDRPTADLAAPDREKLTMLVRMLSQFLKTDAENQTAWLDLTATGNWHWWSWYGDEFETQAAFLKLLVRLDPNDPVAPQMVKYLLNNRKNATWWNSTRDTALCVEAFVEYLNATGELDPEMTVEVLYDGQVRKTVQFTRDNLFTADNSLFVYADELTSGEHTITLRRKGQGPLYYNAYLQNFTLEDFIEKTGLEVKVERRFRLLEKEETATALVAGGRGQAVQQRVEKYKSTPLNSLDKVPSGSLVEVELIVESKNDYESILIEDRKPAGYEPVEVQSGYTGNVLGAYVEFRDERVCFFVGRLPQGKASLTYRLRAETPGSFSALPAKIEAMYAPELKGNSDEFKAVVTEGNTSPDSSSLTSTKSESEK